MCALIMFLRFNARFVFLPFNDSNPFFEVGIVFPNERVGCMMFFLWNERSF